MFNVKKILSFAFLRYVDVGIIALLLIIMANKVGPNEYGSYAYAFILITYSAYVVLGTNQAIVKHYPLSKNNQDKNSFFQYGIFLTSFGVILLLLIFLASSSNDISYLILFISINKLITELAVTLSRVQEKFQGLTYFIYLTQFHCY